MANQQTRRLLTINVGSSSLKAALYRLGAAETVELRATAERIGMPNSRLRVADAQGEALHRTFGRPPGPRCRAGGAVRLAPRPAPGRGAERHRAARRAGRQPVQRADADHRHAARRAAVAGSPRHGAPAAGPPASSSAVRRAYPERSAGGLLRHRLPPPDAPRRADVRPAAATSGTPACRATASTASPTNTSCRSCARWTATRPTAG